MNSKHPWVDPEQIRKLAERLMAPYAGFGESPPLPVPGTGGETGTPATQVAPMLDHDRIVPDPEDQLLGDDIGIEALLIRPEAPVGTNHTLKLKMAELFPHASGMLCGPGERVWFDDGNLGSLRFLVDALAATGPAVAGTWSKWSPKAGEMVCAIVISAMGGQAVLLVRSSTEELTNEGLEQLRLACESHFTAA